MKNLYCILLFFLLLTGCTSCEDDLLPEQLDVQIALSSEQKNYAQDDTLWLTTQFNYPKDSIALFPFSMQVIGPNVKFATDFVLDTSTLFINHNELNSSIVFNYGCPFQADSFDLKLGIVFREKGLHLLQPNQKEMFYHSSEFSCDSLIEHSHYFEDTGEVNYFFDVKNGNFDLYQQAPDLVNEKIILDKKAFLLNVE